MSDFEVVPDAERITSRQQMGGRVMKPLHASLIDGKTVFLPLNGEDASVAVSNRARSALTRRGMNLRARRIERDGVFGLLMWAEPKADR